MCVLVVLIASLSVTTQGVSASAEAVEPGGTADAVSLATTNPDEYAWKLFLYLNLQAEPGAAGVPDPTKVSIRAYDPDTSVVWETWALASGVDVVRASGPISDRNHCNVGELHGGTAVRITNRSEVFKCPATRPASWDDLERGASAEKILSPDLTTAALLGLRFSRPEVPGMASPQRGETRMNRSTYETIRMKGLFSVEGLQKLAVAANAQHSRSIVTFEQSSKEVKARWIHLKSCDGDTACPDKARYHWRSVNVNGARQVWGLASLHIITKDLPNWFWADLGHVDCEKPEGACADSGGKPAITPLSDSTTRDSHGIRPETVGSKWSYYRLRGTQISFTSADGVPTVLSNPMVEATFQRSSCMTCHAYATVGLPGRVSDVTTSIPQRIGKSYVRNAGDNAETGAPDCRRFVAPATEDDSGLDSAKCVAAFADRSGRTVYFQTDFLWSIPFRAFSESEQP